MMHAIPQPQPEVLTTTLPGGDMILLHPRTGQYLTLNETGAFLWQAMGHSATLASLSEALFDRFDVTRTAADDAVRELMHDLEHHKLITMLADDLPVVRPYWPLAAASGRPYRRTR